MVLAIGSHDQCPEPEWKHESWEMNTVRTWVHAVKLKWFIVATLYNVAPKSSFLCY